MQNRIQRQQCQECPHNMLHTTETDRQMQYLRKLGFIRPPTSQLHFLLLLSKTNWSTPPISTNATQQQLFQHDTSNVECHNDVHTKSITFAGCQSVKGGNKTIKS